MLLRGELPGGLENAECLTEESIQGLGSAEEAELLALLALGVGKISLPKIQCGRMVNIP